MRTMTPIDGRYISTLAVPKGLQRALEVLEYKRSVWSTTILSTLLSLSPPTPPSPQHRQHLDSSPRRLILPTCSPRPLFPSSPSPSSPPPSLPRKRPAARAALPATPRFDLLLPSWYYDAMANLSDSVVSGSIFLMIFKRTCKCR